MCMRRITEKRMRIVFNIRNVIRIKIAKKGSHAQCHPKLPASIHPFPLLNSQVNSVMSFY